MNSSTLHFAQYAFKLPTQQTKGNALWTNSNGNDNNKKSKEWREKTEKAKTAIQREGKKRTKKKLEETAKSKRKKNNESSVVTINVPYHTESNRNG